MNVTDLDTKVPAKTPEQSEKRKEMIVRACERMSHQINRVMDFVKLKPLELEIGSVKTIFDSVVHSIVVPEDVKIIYKGDIPEICCDPKVMEALFANLFSNSIQAMEKKGVITVNVINEKNKVIINVQDQGPGIQKQNIDKIFEPLFTTKQEGTGLGLASCKNMVEQHGGTISVTNNPTTFTITLPKIIPLVGEKNVRKSNRN
jgi:signal transduction histidine kinase